MNETDRLAAIQAYIADITEQFQSGHAKEHAYRPALKTLMNAFDDVVAVNDPKRSEHGNPDFIFLKKTNQKIIRGYAEAKDIGVSLDKTEKTNQMERYSGYANLLLTDYLEFRFFKNGEKYKTIVLGRPEQGTLLINSLAGDELALELEEFLQLPPEQIRSGKRLAEIMGAKARRIRNNVREYLAQESSANNRELDKMYKVMRELLVHDLTTDKFADMYAQTLVYGLFVARYGDTTPDDFNRSEAIYLIPQSNPFLRDFFDHIAGPRFDPRLAYIVDELCEIFRVSDVHLLVQKHLRLFEVENDKDPIIHFYEDFLKEYDPAERKKMGAYYTPIPVVRFMIKQVDQILKSEFGLPKGLTDTAKIDHIVTDTGGKKYKNQIHRVQVLDPAVGTATFLNEIINYVHKDFVGQEGRWPMYAEAELIPRLHGFELMMAPYTIAHLKLGMTLQDSGVKNFGKRLGVYLTNTLEEGDTKQADLFAAFGFAETISHEAAEAAKIKHERPIMVVIGNPPYSGESSNNTPYANSLISKYKVEPGGQQKLLERNPKWLNDDYVKFIAFAEDMIKKNGGGVVAMITNNGYLDNPTFRGMRWRLSKTFDKIYILDLHGNAKKKETALDGGKDDNIFDIQQGVGIILAIKNGTKTGELAEVYHAEIYGKRQEKYNALDYEIDFKKIKLVAREYLFVPKDNTGKADYDKGVSLPALFPVNSVGIVTARDSLAIQYTEQEMWDTLNDFGQLPAEVARDKYHLGKDARDWSVVGAQSDIANPGLDRSKIAKISYRPFDERFTYYTGVSRGFQCMARARASNQINGKLNYAIMTSRQNKAFPDWHHAFITEHLFESCLVSNKTSEISYGFLLYLYHDDGTRDANFNQTELKKLAAKLAGEPKPEDVFDYIYAILHSPQYREKYKEFLKSDFPRIPIPTQAEFDRLIPLGRKLRELHLMKAPVDYETTFPEAGSNMVEQLSYRDRKVLINESQYFGNVPEVAWNFYIGGYQPAQKWLKDRKGRTLSNDDLDHYQKIIKILTETDKIMKKIDEK